jgi:hypothetical protein
VLAEESGMEPSVRLQKLLAAVLNQDPSLEIEHRPPTVETPKPRAGFLGALPEGELVGRRVDVERLLAAVEVARSGQGQLVFVSGEPGIGKTRLIQEVMLQAEDYGFRVLVARCYEHHASLPFFPFQEALGSALREAPQEIGIRN